jgi:hypothetical protein
MKLAYYTRFDAAEHLQVLDHDIEHPLTCGPHVPKHNQDVCATNHSQNMLRACFEQAPATFHLTLRIYAGPSDWRLVARPCAAHFRHE